MKRHFLKCEPEPYAAMASGAKLHEFRRDDGRDFEVGDVLVLQEWRPGAGVFTGADLQRRVSYISRGPDWGIPVGYVVMSVPLPDEDGP